VSMQSTASRPPRPTIWRVVELQSRQMRLCSRKSMHAPSMCMTRLNELPLEKTVTVEPMKAFPPLKDLVTDVSWNSGQKEDQEIQAACSRCRRWHLAMAQIDIDRVQSFASVSSVSSARMFVTLARPSKEDEFVGPGTLSTSGPGDASARHGDRWKN